MQSSQIVFKVHRGIRPLSLTLELHGRLASINRDLSLPQTGRNQSIQTTDSTNIHYSHSYSLGLSGESSHTSYRTQYTRSKKRAKTSENITSFWGTRMQHRKTADTELKPPHTHSFHRPHAKAANITDNHTVRQQHMPRWQSPLAQTLICFKSDNSRLNGQINSLKHGPNHPYGWRPQAQKAD